MEAVMQIFFMLLVFGICITPFALVALDIVFYVKKKEVFIFEMIAFFIGSVYMLFAFELWELPEYQEPLNLWGGASMHTPLNDEYFFAVVLFLSWGGLSYFILKFARKTLPPLVEVFLLGGVYVSCGLCLVWMFQLFCGAHPEGSRMGSFDWFMILCLCVVPFLYLLHTGQLMVRLVKERAQKQESVHYNNKALEKVNLWLLKGANLFWVGLIALLPILGILVMLLCLFGQQPDSVILAFTKTSDWILSGEVSPPPVEYDTHYLCTVSLRGHKRLVKPLRYGIRRGEKIVVNRQLCVANAFEQLIMERTPRFHKAVRNFYDTYGYPISRHINKAWTADVIYLMMKPLEWVFLAVLYLFDEKPENRISSQYLPTVKKCG